MLRKIVFATAVIVALGFYATAFAQTATPATQLCPTAKTGDAYTSCQSLVCGQPKTQGDQTRTKVGTAEVWEPWSTIASTGPIVSCAANTASTWTTKSALGLPEPGGAVAVSTPPSAPVATPSSLTASWVAPTTYVDTTPIADPTSITYNLYSALQGAPKVQVASGIIGLVTMQTVTPGTWCYEITAVVASVESAHSPESCGVMASSTPAPSAPGKPTVTSVTVATTVYMELQVPDGFSFLAVGTVPLGTACDPTQRVNDFSVVPASAVTWTGKIQRLAALAACSSP